MFTVIIFFFNKVSVLNKNHHGCFFVTHIYPIFFLKKRLFRKNEDFSRRYHIPELQKHQSDAPTSWRTPEISQQLPYPLKPKTPAQKILWWGLGGGLGAILVSGGILFYLYGGFSGTDTEKYITLNVTGADQVTSGKKAIWRVSYRNDNKIKLENVEIIFEFPDGSQPVAGQLSQAGIRRETRKIENLEPGDSGETEFFALPFGPKDSTITGHVALEYRPADSSARFSKNIEYQSQITGTLLGVQVEIPQNLQSGQEAEVKIHITSSAESAFRGLSLGVDMPEAFKYISANPAPLVGNSIWQLGDLAPGAERIISIKGMIGKTPTAETFHTKVGLYNRVKDTWAVFNSASETFSVASTFLSVNLVTTRGEIASGVTVAGNTIEVRLDWRNNMSVAIHNVSIEGMIDSDLFDFRTAKSKEGEYSDDIKGFRWVPGRISELSAVDPGTGGSYTFSIALKDPIPQKTLADKNFVVRFRGKISSTETPQGFEGVDISGSDTLDLKLASRPKFSQRGYYFDSRVKNTGPLPPRVGQETTYLIVWSLTNTLNDVKNVVVKATLPSYIDWKNIIIPSDPSLTFKSTTGELTWSPDSITVGTGYIQPPREVAFQVGLTPSLPQVRTTPQLVSEAVMTGEDTFTGTQFSLTSFAIDSTLRDDPEVARTGGTVKE